MSEIVERVAREMFERFMDWQFGQPPQWEGDPPPNADELDREWRDRKWVEQSEFYLRQARVAQAILAAEKRGAESARDLLQDALDFLEGSDPGVISGGHRNSYLRVRIASAIRKGAS